MTRTDILTNAANVYFTLSVQETYEAERLAKIEFAHAVRGRPIDARLVNAQKRNCFGLRDAYALKAVDLLNRI